MSRPALLCSVLRPGRARRWLAALAMVAGLVPATLPAAEIADLVAERATREYGSEMPAKGTFNVRMSADLPTEGEFIREFWIDRDTGQFIANVVRDSGEVTRVWGLATLTLPVPVPVRRLMPDTIVQPEDVEMVELPWVRINAFAVTEREDLVGMQVRRMLSPGRPVQLQSVIPPVIISRGERVVIQLSYGGLQLSAKGRAISDAHLGQEVRVVNLSSNKTIVGIARADGVVEASF
ncbi:flagellar basal body P-ring formation chaperone FlgA [Pseudodonghicola flavimaris]|uniref:Flagella basal body P-ring formation protein FlgA n=1 Tax=Pseudodonghicola flavimaris TaxID=3050036 RepID=A0ABT7EWK7_9RHOB|nr:flagellar basal body P-ring formation chaperone FlgA [Pseudodonghicola flavimaris]MDK3016726.1 flagellar basal body P-ring formation chaperone FlgA [Pseudodonghicola flavimaris]